MLSMSFPHVNLSEPSSSSVKEVSQKSDPASLTVADAVYRDDHML